MRVNVYSEELRELTDDYGPRVRLIHKKVVPSFEHSAIEILLGDRVIHSDNEAGVDDDTPAVKFWYGTEYERNLLLQIFQKAIDELQSEKARK